MRKITVTEENFEKVLAKMQKRCNRHRMIDFESYYDENVKKEVAPYSHPIRFGYEFDDNGNRTRKLKVHDKFLEVNKHRFREAFETGNNKLWADMYDEDKVKPLIHISFGLGCASVIYVGDEVTFLPFGIFIVRYHNVIPMKVCTFKNVYVPNYISGKIKDINEVLAARRKAEEEYEDWEMQRMEEDLRFGYEDDYDSDYSPDYDE